MHQEQTGEYAGVPAKWRAWSGSLTFHLIVLLLLVYWFQFQPARRSAPGERNAVGVVVFKQATDAGATYTDSQGNEFSEAGEVPSLEDLLSHHFSEADLSQVLPSPAIGPSSPTGQTARIAGAGSHGGLSGVGGFGNSLGGKVKVDLFGTEGTGSKFVFVFDRSGSMNEFSGRPLRAAKTHLIQSLEPLTDLHQFNIIFYNEDPIVWSPGKLPWANERNKENAATFVRGVLAMGGTRHYEPLRAAIRLNPDVIFFLTDGEDKDALNDGQLADIRRLNRNGVQINAIQFGIGAESRGRNFLRTLAAQNEGQFQYINVAELRESAPP